MQGGNGEDSLWQQHQQSKEQHCCWQYWQQVVPAECLCNTSTVHHLHALVLANCCSPHHVPQASLLVEMLGYLVPVAAAT
jgi:hypothetical protein